MKMCPKEKFEFNLKLGKVLNFGEILFKIYTTLESFGVVSPLFVV
jgi:hypothetical protein